MTQPTPVQLHAFHSRMQSCNYIFSDGTRADFVKGTYYTNDESRIQQLQNEVRLRHPVIYIVPGQETVMSDDLDPVAVLRKQLRAELLLEALAAIDPNRNMGDYAQGKLNAASTSDIAAVAAGGNAVSLQVQLRAMAQAAGIKADPVTQVAETINPGKPALDEAAQTRLAALVNKSSDTK